MVPTIRSVEIDQSPVDTVAVHKAGHFVDCQLQMLQARSMAQKRQRESPGFNKNQEFKEWIASHGDVSCGSEFGRPQSYRKVTFDDQPKIVENAEGNVEGVPCRPHHLQRK